MNALIDAAIGRARTVVAALILILIAGAYAYVTIPKEAEPDVNIPILYVNLSHEGISPADAERLLIRPMEQELRDIEGVDVMRSISFLGGANIVLEFDAGFDADLALTDVREKVDLAKPELPDDTDEPTVHEINLSLFPIIVVTLSGDLPGRALLVSDYYGCLGQRDGRWFPKTALHDFVQVISGQGVPPPNLESWQAIYADAGCGLVHALEDDNASGFIHIVRL